MVSVVPIYITLVFDMTVGSESELGDLGRLIQVCAVDECGAHAALVKMYRRIRHICHDLSVKAAIVCIYGDSV